VNDESTSRSPHHAQNRPSVERDSVEAVVVVEVGYRTSFDVVAST
jgi:hypothetical protein